VDACKLNRLQTAQPPIMKKKMLRLLDACSRKIKHRAALKLEEVDTKGCLYYDGMMLKGSGPVLPQQINLPLI